MTTWTEQGKEIQSVNSISRVSSIDMRINFATPVPNWNGASEEITPLDTKYSAGNTTFGSESTERNVVGFVQSKGGNGSNRLVITKKSYYWHL